ncbi:MAG: ankyrin repeat domain-containing protein [Gammaproteobacteria bacterium]
MRSQGKYKKQRIDTENKSDNNDMLCDQKSIPTGIIPVDLDKLFLQILTIYFKLLGPAKGLKQLDRYESLYLKQLDQVIESILVYLCEKDMNLDPKSISIYLPYLAYLGCKEIVNLLPARLDFVDLVTLAAYAVPVHSYATPDSEFEDQERTNDFLYRLLSTKNTTAYELKKHVELDYLFTKNRNSLRTSLFFMINVALTMNVPITQFKIALDIIAENQDGELLQVIIDWINANRRSEEAVYANVYETILRSSIIDSIDSTQEEDWLLGYMLPKVKVDLNFTFDYPARYKDEDIKLSLTLLSLVLHNIDSDFYHVITQANSSIDGSVRDSVSTPKKNFLFSHKERTLEIQTLGQNPLHIIAETKKLFPLAKSILALPKLDINATTQDGHTALMIAARIGNEALVSLLLARSANTLIKTPAPNQKTAYDIALASKRKKIAGLIKTHEQTKQARIVKNIANQKSLNSIILDENLRHSANIKLLFDYLYDVNATFDASTAAFIIEKTIEKHRVTVKLTAGTLTALITTLAKPTNHFSVSQLLENKFMAAYKQALSETKEPETKSPGGSSRAPTNKSTDDANKKKPPLPPSIKPKVVTTNALVTKILWAEPSKKQKDKSSRLITADIFLRARVSSAIKRTKNENKNPKKQECVSKVKEVHTPEAITAIVAEVAKVPELKETPWPKSQPHQYTTPIDYFSAFSETPTSWKSSFFNNSVIDDLFVEDNVIVVNNTLTR